ncbi:hypothetical protein RI129_003238 [Pyrocoelia pectoralis]|uniref:PHD-type domain-containing protein n=1 Tax=Pyrocoelia pectoralis TaxID=417401 RepID=A0AAN7VPT9_9COLE
MTTAPIQENKKSKEIIKCSSCEEELVSDVEEDEQKNIGCDQCERWFHLGCTEFIGLKYEDVKSRDFSCLYCS